MKDGEERQNGIEAEAAEWVVRQGSSDFSDQDRLRLDEWRQRSPAHEAALRFASRTWADLGSAGGSSIAPSSRPPRRAWYAAAASVLVMVTAGAWYAGVHFSGLPIEYRTAPGEMRVVRLPDGSAVHLNTLSAVSLRFSEHERRVELLDGEAVFTVAPEAGRESKFRPFIVMAGSGSVRALGTEFGVHRRQDAVTVTVFKHSVEVSLGKDAVDQSASVVLSRGESVSYGPVSGLGRISEVNLSHAAAWRNGRLVFDRVPLGQVVEEINRYRSGRIVLNDDALAGREVSGVFLIDDLDNSLNTIARGLNAHITPVSPSLVVLH